MRFSECFAFILLLVACNPLTSDQLPEDTAGWEGVSHDMMVLGEQLDNPYTVDNMQKALLSLYPTKAGKMTVSPTDMYVRFLPKSNEQFEALEALGLDLMDHPLDYRIVREGDYYHDPEIPEGEATWQYAVVRPYFTCPKGIVYEILDQCYIPDNTAQTRSDDGIDWAAVERESFLITGNEDLLGDPLTRAEESCIPSGTISIVDENYDGGKAAGVAGIQVCANSFVKFATAYTDEDGNYTLGKSFSSDIRYRLIFKNEKGFGIGLNLILLPASTSTLGKNPPSGVSMTVTPASDRRLFTRCAVNNAIYDYIKMCSSDDCAITPPPANLRVWLFQNLSSSSAPMLQQGAIIDSDLVSSYLGEYAPLVKMFLPDVTIGLKNASDYDSVYGVTVHELSHSSHFMKAGKTYWDKYICYIAESYLTSGWTLYGAGTEENAGYCAVGEMWAYYMQNKLMTERYGRQQTTYGSQYWFCPQVLLYMDERGVDKSRIFKSLGAYVHDVDTFQETLEGLYPEYRSVITQAFNRYL